MRPLLRPLALLALAAATLPAAAQFNRPEDAIKYRKSSFTLMAAHFGRVAAMANGRIPFDAAAAASNADIALTLSKLPYAAFVDGTDKGDTAARPEIWRDRAKFNAAATRMQDEMVKLNAAAKAGNLDQMKTAAGAVGAACKACHDDFRRE